MKKETRSTLSQWTFWAPAKFSIITFICLSAITIIGAMFTNYKPNVIIYSILTLSFIYCVIKLLKRFQHTHIDKRSFIAITNAQSLITVITTLSIYLLSLVITKLLFNITSFLTGALVSIAFLCIMLGLFYILGIFFLNIYATYHRCTDMKIPTWKFVFSFPFGIPMFYTAGYLMNDSQKKKNSIEIKSNWYNRLLNWILKNKQNTIVSFISIILLSWPFSGTGSIIFTFTMALIYGIWALNVDEKQLQKNIGRFFSSMAVIINFICIITMFIIVIYTTQTQEPVAINNESITVEATETAPQTKQ